MKKKLITSSLIISALIGTHLYDPGLYYWSSPPKISENHFILSDQSLEISHKDLEERLGVEVKGEYSDNTANNLLTVFEDVQNTNSNLLNSLEKVVILPLEIETPYAGLAVSDKLMVLKDKVEKSTIYHELGHNYSLSLDSNFWNQWNEISYGNYKANDFVPIYMVAFRFFPSLTHNEHSFHQHSGLLTEYGSTNRFEDVAEFVEDIYTNQKKIKTVPQKEQALYQKKLDLLHFYEFISTDQYNNAKNNLSINSFGVLEDKLELCLEELENPKITALSDYSVDLYQSEICTISEFWSQYGSGLTIAVDDGITQGSLDIIISLKNTYHLKVGGSKNKTISEPKELISVLADKGYLENAVFPNKQHFREGESKEEVARRIKVDQNQLLGPIPYLDSYSGEKQMVYYTVDSN